MKIVWDQDRPYSQGVDRGVLYLDDKSGVPWNGLVSVVERRPNDTADLGLYFDGIRYNITTAPEDLDLAVSAITYPPQFAAYDGYSSVEALQQKLTFGFAYRVMTTKGYELHIVYNAIASSSPRSWKTLGGPVTVTPFVWDFQSVPQAISSSSPSAHIILDSSVAYSAAVKSIEDILYGTATTAARLPTIQEVVDICAASPQFTVVDHGDGTWTATGPSDAITVNADGSFEIRWPTTVFVAPDTYRLTTS